MNEFVKRDNQEDNFEDIWLFVEEKLRTIVPTYFKNVLKVCGYNNGISIALIEESDVAYIESEVRKGNVTNALVGIEEKKILEGSYKDKDNFEFTMGHRKFLMFIVNFLKTYSAEHGLNSFTFEHANKRSKCKRKAKSSGAVCSNKKMKSSALESAMEIPMRGRLSIEKSNLLTKAITSLINHSAEMYVKICVKDIEMGLEKVSNDLVAIETHDASDKNVSDSAVSFSAKIVCPLCSKNIPVAHSSAQLPSGRLSKPWWNTSNFDDHLKKHEYNFDVEKGDKTSEVLTENSHNTDVVIRTQDSKDGNIKHNTSIDDSYCGGGMLKIFMESAQRNSNRNKHGYRHDITTKMFAGFLKMVGGLLTYETLHANFPKSLPSVSTVNRFITDNGPPIIEGEMRVDELLLYLQSRNMPLRISISEDGTRCTPNILYDPKTNQLMGYALPLDANGMPIISSFPARNVREIYQHYTNPSNFISSTAYVQMAQPTEPAGAPPFCLMMYSTDNKFTALDVYRRWIFQAGKLNGKGIKLNNIASDGDPRPLMAMKVLSCIGQSNRSYMDCEWYSCGGYVETTFTQDYIHIITKERNRILKYSRIFPIGEKIISSSHLKYLIDNVSKDKHLLTNSDIEPKDRQNFPSAEKVCSERSMQCLLDYVPGSEGTVIYLKAMRNVLNAFQKTELTSEERIFSIWYACFFCRAWRSWILNSDKSKMSAKNKPKSYYNLKDNFMSSNCYTCIELNAHALVKQVLVEDDGKTCDENSEQSHHNKRSNYFSSSLFDSQVCESIFRQVRSFTSTFCTVVNFTILDIMNRIRKIQLQNEIIHTSDGRIKFPRFEKKADDISKSISQGRQPFNGLSRKTIMSQIEKAKDAVIADFKNLGIDTSKLDLHCQVQPTYAEDLLRSDSDLNSSDSEDVYFQNEHENECYGNDFFNKDEDACEDECDELHEDVNFISGITGELMLKDYTQKMGKSQDGITLDEKGPFALVVDSTGESKVVRKSAVCYVLAKDKHKLSSDRLQRVQEREYAVDKSSNRAFPCADNFSRNQEISIGDWCVFPVCVEKGEEHDNESNSALLGLVLGFTYLKGKTFKQREYTKSFASVEASIDKPVGVLCDFYSFNKFGVLESVPGDKHKFIKIDDYKATIRPLIKGGKSLRISQNLLVELNKINL